MPVGENDELTARHPYGSGRCLLTATRFFLFSPSALAVNSEANDINAAINGFPIRSKIMAMVLPP